MRCYRGLTEGIQEHKLRFKKADFRSKRGDLRPGKAILLDSTNRSPKGNMWSAIPVALLCMIVNLCEGKQGSGPKGRTDLRPSSFEVREG